LGQSFTPSLTAISFCAFNVYDGDFSHNAGGTIYVNLRSNSISGSILSSTAPVILPNSFFGITNFFFASPITITPGALYVLEVMVLAGSDYLSSNVSDASYTRGSAISQGVPALGANLWFQEGIIVVPEPSPVVLAALGGSGFFYFRKRKR
jgi:hypothetical protein